MAALFEELTIGTLVAHNRLVRSATAESLALPSGYSTEKLVALYRELAEGGVGTIITGYAYVMPDGKPSENAMGAYGEAVVASYRSLIDAVHEAGAKVVMQLVYGGSKSKLAPDDARRIPQAEDGAPNVRILGPSSVEHPKTHLVPIAASSDDLARVVGAFGEAAAWARASGFDGVEIHAAHGYLLSQFLDGRFNKRSDCYGGPLANRVRLAVECVSAAREAVGEGYPVLVKLNSCDDFGDPSGETGGLSEDESAQVAAWLVSAGASCIDVSGDWHAASARCGEGVPYFAGFGARLASELDVPVIVTGGWRRIDVIERHLAESGIAGIGMSRPLICEPDLPARWRKGERHPSECTGCGLCAKSIPLNSCHRMA